MKSAYQVSRAARRVMKQAEAAVRGERRRQIYGKGYTTERDDDHRCGDLTLVAAGYLFAALPAERAALCAAPWPWPLRPLQAKADPRFNLVIAAALLLAEIERLDRAEEELEPKLPFDEGLEARQ